MALQKNKSNKKKQKNKKQKNPKHNGESDDLSKGIKASNKRELDITNHERDWNHHVGGVNSSISVLLPTAKMIAALFTFLFYISTIHLCLLLKLKKKKTNRVVGPVRNRSHGPTRAKRVHGLTVNLTVYTIIILKGRPVIISTLLLHSSSVQF